MTPLEFISEKTFFTPEELLQEDRGRKPLAEARQLLYWICWMIEGRKGFTRIGQECGRDRTSVRFGVRRVEADERRRTKAQGYLKEYLKRTRHAAAA